MPLGFHRLNQVVFIGRRQGVGTEQVLHWMRTMVADYIGDVAQEPQEVVIQQSMNLGYLMFCALRMLLDRYFIFFVLICLIWIA